MRPRLPFVLALGLLLLACRLSAAGEASGREDRPDLTGVWLLNWELSENPRAQVPSGAGDGDRRRRPVGPGSGGGGFGGPGRGGFGGRSGRFGSPSPDDRDARALDRAAQFQTVADLLTAPRQMTIRHDAREILFTYDDGRYVRLVPDDRVHAGIAGGTRVTRQARWEGDTLIAEIKLESNHKIVHEFALRLDGEQLVVTTTLEPRGSQDELKFRRVYAASGE